MNWQLLSTDIPGNSSELIDLLLKNRGIVDVKSFFHPPLPSSLTAAEVGIDIVALKSAISKINQAIRNKKKIVVFGDYDADGICATTILWQALASRKAKVMPFLPDRQKHGYGLSVRALNDLCQESKPDLIITVDNGIVATKAALAAQERGIDLIITDHHVPESDAENLPPALAIVHTTQLCGTAVAWFLARELAPKLANEQLDLCAIATIADQVKLTGFNRSFAYHGLQALRQTQRPGLLALIEVSAVSQADLTSGTVSFQIVPRINAAGRVGDSYTALRLLCTNKQTSATTLARQLSEVNTRRQKMTLDYLANAELQVVSQLDSRLLIVASRDYHEGVIGLVAGRLTQQYHKPSIAIAIGELEAKGSARSVYGVNIIDIIREVREDLLSVGGHPLAAGFSLTNDNLELVRRRLLTAAEKKIDPSFSVATKMVECKLPHHLLTLTTLASIANFEPFGMGNSRPRFLLTNLSILDVRLLGKNGKHCKLLVELETGRQLSVLWWNCGDINQEKLAETTELTVKLDVNNWRGKQSLQLVM